jgi:hypothetical protein
MLGMFGTIAGDPADDGRNRLGCHMDVFHYFFVDVFFVFFVDILGGY